MKTFKQFLVEPLSESTDFDKTSWSGGGNIRERNAHHYDKISMHNFASTDSLRPEHHKPVHTALAKLHEIARSHLQNPEKVEDYNKTTQTIKDLQKTLLK